MGLSQCKQACDTFQQHVDTNPARQCPSSGILLQNAECPWYLNVEVDETGCRKFPALPPPGQHPRLFFTKDEIPMLAARFTGSSTFSRILRGSLEVSTRDFRNWYRRVQGEVDASEMKNPSRKTVERFLVEDAARNDAWLLSFIYSFITQDDALMRDAVEAVVFYARVIINSEHIAKKENLKQKPFHIWHSDSFNVGHSFMLGGTAFAACYDLMWHQFSTEQVETVRKALSLATSGRRSWGMGFPARRTQSNWSGYHGDLYAMTAAIEGEDGFDREVFDLFEGLMLNFVSFAIYDSGHPVEDAYALNLALREGSMALLAMARRGLNLFRHPNYRKLWTQWTPFALEPHRSGEIYGGSSGTALIYPTSFCVAKYVFPQDPVVDFVFRHYMSEDGKRYSRANKLQSRSHLSLFGLPSADTELEHCETHAPRSLRLPLTFFCNNRGKAIMRSDWTEDAMWFTLDARGDPFLIGHDVPSRGSFVLNALGRNWSNSPEWNLFKEPADYSLVSIDGESQKDKAPSVKFLDCKEHEKHKSTFASCDLTYAYNWMWTSWSKAGDDKARQGFEKEPHGPRDFGMTAWWLPDQLHGQPSVGFEGLHQWRKRFNSVEKVTRSALMVREAALPFLIIADNVKQDSTTRTYTWNMVTKEDVELISFDGTDAILGEAGKGDRRLLVRHLAPQGQGGLKCSQTKYSKENPKEKPGADGLRKQFQATRIEWSATATEMQFRFLVVAYRQQHFVRPSTSWESDHTLLVKLTEKQIEPPSAIRIKFDTGRAGEAIMSISA